MKPYLTILGAALVVCITHGAVAENETTSEHAWSANIGVTSDYMFRGISRSNEDPAVGGGFDYAYDPYGFYAGSWATSTEFRTNSGDDASVEMDFYGGFNGRFSNSVGWDIGGIYYYFPGQDADRGTGEFEMFELYTRLNYTFETLYEPTVDLSFDYSPDYFGEDGDSIYFAGDFSARLPNEFGFYARIGYLDVEGELTNPRGYDYAHYALGLTRQLGIFTLDLSWQDAEDNCDDLAGEDYCQAVVFGVSSHW